MAEAINISSQVRDLNNNGTDADEIIASMLKDNKINHKDAQAVSALRKAMRSGVLSNTKVALKGVFTDALKKGYTVNGDTSNLKNILSMAGYNFKLSSIPKEVTQDGRYIVKLNKQGWLDIFDFKTKTAKIANSKVWFLTSNWEFKVKKAFIGDPALGNNKVNKASAGKISSAIRKDVTSQKDAQNTARIAAKNKEIEKQNKEIAARNQEIARLQGVITDLWWDVQEAKGNVAELQQAISDLTDTRAEKIAKGITESSSFSELNIAVRDFSIIEGTFDTAWVGGGITFYEQSQAVYDAYNNKVDTLGKRYNSIQKDDVAGYQKLWWEIKDVDFPSLSFSQEQLQDHPILIDLLMHVKEETPKRIAEAQQLLANLEIKTKIDRANTAPTVITKDELVSVVPASVVAKEVDEKPTLAKKGDRVYSKPVEREFVDSTKKPAIASVVTEAPLDETQAILEEQESQDTIPAVTPISVNIPNTSNFDAVQIVSQIDLNRPSSLGADYGRNLLKEIPWVEQPTLGMVLQLLKEAPTDYSRYSEFKKHLRSPEWHKTMYAIQLGLKYLGIYNDTIDALGGKNTEAALAKLGQGRQPGKNSITALIHDIEGTAQLEIRQAESESDNSTS